MRCLADGREIQDISIRTMWLRFQRSIGLRRPWSWRHQVSSTMHETLLQWQSFPCQESRIVLADGLLYSVWVLLYDNWKRGTLITVCTAEWNHNVQGQDNLVVVCLPYGCPENGSCHVIHSICAIDLPPSELQKGPFFQRLCQCQTYSLCVISIFASQLLVCRSSTFIFVLGSEVA